MSLRPHGRGYVSARTPRALAICDRCGFMVNHGKLRWQYQWQGPRLNNTRILVCPDCYDTPQEQLRTFVLPMDPIVIPNARPENYSFADNPASHLGYDPANAFLPVGQRGMSIGNLVMGAGVESAFDGAVVTTSSLGTTISRQFSNSANLANSVSSFQNWVGKNWAADATGTLATLPSTVPSQTHVVSAFTIVAPSDQAFLRTGATGYRLEGSNNGATWTTIYSGTTAGAIGEIITANTTSQGLYQYHRINIQGDGVSQIGLAQVSFDISDAGPNEI